MQPCQMGRLVMLKEVKGRGLYGKCHGNRRKMPGMVSYCAEPLVLKGWVNDFFFYLYPAMCFLVFFLILGSIL